MASVPLLVLLMRTDFKTTCSNNKRAILGGTIAVEASFRTRATEKRRPMILGGCECSGKQLRDRQPFRAAQSSNRGRSVFWQVT